MGNNCLKKTCHGGRRTFLRKLYENTLKFKKKELAKLEENQ